MKIFKNNHVRPLLYTVAILVAVQVVGSFFFYRLDLTQDHRYTLSSTSLNILKKVENPMSIKVYMQGELPAEFKRLQQETKQILEEFQAYNSRLVVEFVDPMENPDESMALIKDLYKRGLTPVNITVDDKGKQSQAMVFPWAIATYDDKEVAIPLLKNQMGTSTTQKVIGSVQHLEYSFSEAFDKITKAKQKKVAIIKGNGELRENTIAKFLLQVRDRYYIAPFTLDSVAQNPIKSLQLLNEYDLAVIAKPTEAFSESEKQVLDQYLMQGGKTIWLVDQVVAEMDSLYHPSGASMAFPRDLNVNDLFFKYGIRLNPDLVKDEQGTPIQLASGAPGSATRFQQFNWKFAPLLTPTSSHPIVKNLGGIKFDFANSIDTLKNGVKKTVLLQSSPYSKRIGTPTAINLSQVSETASPSDYPGTGGIPVAVLLEGSFSSAFENRVKAFEQPHFKNVSIPTKMIVVSDGDIVRNQLDKEQMPVELGYDKRSGNLYDNKDFLMNSVNYLLDDTGLINIRSKDFDLPLLDKEKVYTHYTSIQILTIGLPILILALFGLLFTYLRLRKYAR